MRASINQPSPHRILVYGMPGSGKTTFATCERPPAEGEQSVPRGTCVVIQTEDGLGNIPVAAFPLSRSYEDAIEAIKELATEEHQFTELVIDSMDWLDALIIEHVLKKNGWQTLADGGYGKGYDALEQEWRRFFRILDKLRVTKSMRIIMTAHAAVTKIEEPGIEPYDSYAPKMSKKGKAVLMEYCDVMLFARQKIIITRNPGENQQKKIAIPEDGRVLITQPSIGVIAKNRYNLPKEINLSWEDFSREIGY